MPAVYSGGAANPDEPLAAVVSPLGSFFAFCISRYSLMGSWGNSKTSKLSSLLRSPPLSLVQQLLQDLMAWFVRDLLGLCAALVNVSLPYLFCFWHKYDPSLFDRFCGWFAFRRFLPPAPHSKSGPWTTGGFGARNVRCTG